MKIVCPQCESETDKPTGAVNRARKTGSPVYCNRTCAGIARRKNALWETLNEVKSGKKPPAEADAIASQSREILRTVKTQLQIARQANRQVTSELISFSENSSPNK